MAPDDHSAGPPISNRKIRDRAALLPVIGLILLIPPIANVFQLDARVAGIPFTALYLFGVWALLIAGAAHAGEPVNINTADAEALAEAINGVGIKKARDIVAYRQENGPFETVEELAEVRGIGMQTVDRSRENLTVKSDD